MRSGYLWSGIWGILVWVAGIPGVGIFHADAQLDDPVAAIGIWEFDSGEVMDGAVLDELRDIPLELVGGAELSSGGGGRTGKGQDRSLSFGVTGSEAEPTHARVTGGDPVGKDFLDQLNQSNAGDQITVVFWQRWEDGAVANSSSVWFASPSANNGNRGLQSHLPWGNNIVYFDTSGCCGSPERRLNGGIGHLSPSVDWEEWNHVALIKDGGAKQVWINGQLALNQNSGALPLTTDWTSMYLAQSPTEPNVAFHGWMDDVGVFGSALTSEQIKALADGAVPTDLIAPPAEWPPAISELFPDDGTQFHPVDDGLSFRVAVLAPNEIEAGDIRLNLNGDDVSSQLSLTGGPHEWTARYSGSLIVNRDYIAEVQVSDISGRESSTDWSFDTGEVPPDSDLKNYAVGAESYMMRFTDSLPPTRYGNDGNYDTHTETTPRAVGSFFEVDLGEERALYQIRVVPADGFQSRMTHTTVRIYDANHDSVFSEHLGGTEPVFDVWTPGPVFGRYVRVGFENKERSEPGTFWYLGLKELEAFGRPVDEVGILNFDASRLDIASGDVATLNWEVEDVRSLKLYPPDEDMLPITQPDGRGTLKVSPVKTTEYTLVGELFGEILTRSITVQVDGMPLPPQITELVADNTFSLEDGFGAAPDWIEIRNPNNQALNLEGFGLSDDPSDIMKWVFPEGVILHPHSNIIVFASGRNIFDSHSHRWHTNFSLNRNGESVTLTAPDGKTILDVLAYASEQAEDLAFGRTLTGNLAYMEPTPGMDNETAHYVGWLRPVTFSQPRGFYENNFTLTLDHEDPEAEIRVSYNGGARAFPYVGPLDVDGTISVQVSVRKPGFKSPPVQTHTYLFIEDTLQGPNMDQGVLGVPAFRERARQGLKDLPSINVSVDRLPDDWDERPASVEVFLPGHEPIFENAGVERFGGAWTHFAKKNYRLKFRAEYGAKKLEAPLFDGFDHGFQVVDQFDELDLRAGGHDMSSRGFYMSARFSEDSMLEMGSLNPHGRFVNLYFNGKYWGQYHMRERLTDAFLADYLGGQTDDFTNVRGNDNNGSSFILGTPDPVNRDPWLNVLEAKGDFEQIRHWVDVPHLIDFMLMWYFGNAESEYRSAGPVQPGSGFKFWLGDADGHIRSPGDRTGNSGPAGIFGSLVNEGHPDFMMLLADRAQMHLFNGGALTPERNILRLERRMEEIRNSLVTESARWGYRSPGSWENAARDAINDLFPTQTQRLLSRLRARGYFPALDAPVLGQHGGVITDGTIIDILTNGGSIYYTLDGTDPRLPGGDIHPNALVIEGGGASEVTRPKGNWQYLDIGEAPSGDWTALDFDATGWKSGNAPLGYGDPGMATTLDFGPQSNNKFNGYYFRKEFEITDPEGMDHVTIHVVRDDGVAIYLNGDEIVRDNLPSGELRYSTRAISAAGGGDESLVREFKLPRDLFRMGKNVLAAEVHQASASSSDLRFDAWLQSSISIEITLNSDDLFKGRAFDGTNWSALTESQFFAEPATPPQPGDLIISEIHYNPDGSDEFEFIELMNLSDKTLDLSGIRIQNGVNLLVSDGTRLARNAFALGVENPDAFDQRYRNPESRFYYPDIQVLGVWDGQLNDGGERIEVRDRHGILLTSVDFENESPWPLSPDGNGSSLELLDPASANHGQPGNPIVLNDAGQWRASPLYHGTPGRIEDGIGPVQLNLLKIGQNQDFILNWDAQAGSIYRLESTPDLASPNWTEVMVYQPDTNRIIEFRFNAEQGESTQFFRVVAE